MPQSWGWGAVLYQLQEDGIERVIGFASRALNKAERNYDAHRLEFLALKWAVTEKFHEYLYGGSFNVLYRQQSTHVRPHLSQIRCDRTQVGGSVGLLQL